MRTLSSFLKNWPSLTIGLLTVGLFFALPGSSAVIQPVLRVFVAPLEIMRSMQVIAGIESWPMPLQLLLGAPLLFLPHVAADLCLRWLRRRFVGPPLAAA